MASYTTRYFSFGQGFAQSTDDRMLEPGSPRAVENLINLKNGALGMRLDYDALAMTTPALAGTTCKIFDVAEFNGRLVGFGMDAALGTNVARDLYEYVNQPLFGWFPTDPNSDPRLCQATHVRNMGRLPAQNGNTTGCDVAAGGGRVCLVFDLPAGTGVVHVFDPDTDSTLLITSSGVKRTRVCAVGSVFFIAGTFFTDTQLRVFRFDPAVNAVPVLIATNLDGLDGTTISAWDMLTNEAGTGFSIVIARVTPAITILRRSSTGAAVQTITAAAVAVTYVTVFEQAARVHLAVVLPADTVDLYTYNIGSGLQENHSVGLAGVGFVHRQAGICVAGIGTDLCVIFESYGIGSGPVSADVYHMGISPTTHAVSATRLWHDVQLDSKPATIPLSEAFGGVHVESRTGGTDASPSSNFLGIIGIAETNATEQVACYTDKLIAWPHDANDTPIGLQTLAKDASTGKYYWVRLVNTGVVVSNEPLSVPVVSEVEFGTTSRRQTAFVADLLYVAGGSPQVFDGRMLCEAAFQEKPRILEASSFGSGSLEPAGVYQLVLVWEWLDSKGKKVQSAPSEVSEVVMGGGNTAITVVASTPHSARDNATNEAYGSTLRVVVYRTVDTTGGDFTFFRDPESEFAFQLFGDQVVVVCTMADQFLEDQEVLYTQGSRGTLSGPLPFDAPEACSTLAVSADMVLSGGAPEGARVQEGRPQFIGEEMNWSDEIGFQRDIRGDVIAVARLDERRIIFSSSEIFQMDGPGLDDVGNGEFGAPRRLASDVGLYGGRLGWRSIVEVGKDPTGGLFFQGKADLIYMLLRGGSSPTNIGIEVKSLLALYPVITAAVYIAETESVCFACNNTALTDAIVLVYHTESSQWFSQGPFGTGIVAATRYQQRLVLVRGTTVYQQRLAHPPLAFINNAWRSGTIHHSGHGQEGQIFSFHFFGTFRGNCTIQCIVNFDGGSTSVGGATETLAAVPVSGLTVGAQFAYAWTTNQMKCENFTVDFVVTSLAGAATAGLEYNFWAFQNKPGGKAALRGPAQMS